MVKKFAWSWSKVKNFETCPHRHNQVDNLKNFQDGGEAMIWGNQVHDAMAKGCRDGAPLPSSMAEYQRWVDIVRAGPGQLLVEQKYAITKMFGATPWMAPTAWYRGIADVVRIHENVALALDWKTGQVKEDSVQLALMAQCIFAHFPAVQAVRTEFVWLQEDCTTPGIFTRADMAALWNGLLPRVDALNRAFDTKDYPKKPSGLCLKWCPVKSCEFHGKGARG